MLQPPSVFSRSLLRRLSVLLCVGAGLALLLFITQQAMADEKSAVPDAPGSISGSVTDQAGVPLPGIVITAFQQTNNYAPWQVVRVVQTDQTGAYRIGLLSAGLYRLLFSDPKGVLAETYYPNAAVVDAATDIPIAGNDVKNVNMVLALGGQITGTVTSLLTTGAGGGGGSSDSSTYYAVRVFQKLGLQWFNVRALGLSPQQATYRLTGLPAGVYRVCMSSANPPYSYSGFDPAQECYANVYALDDASDVTVKAGETTSAINFVLGDGTDLAQISGKVTALDGTPLAKVAVNAARVYTDSLGIWFQYTQTNNAGVYQLRNLLPGSYLLSFEDHSGAYVSEIYSNVLRSDQATLLTVARREQRAGIDAKLTPAGHITGTLRIVGEGVGQYASVTVYQPTGASWQPAYPFSTASVDAQTGHYHIDGLPAGVYKVAGYASINNLPFQGFYGGNSLDAATPFTVATSETKTNIDLQLTQAFTLTPFSGQISGTVTANGAPVAGIKVALYPNNCCLTLPTPPPAPALTPVPIPTATPMPNQAAASQVGRTAGSSTVNDLRPFVYVYTDAQGHYMIDGLLDGLYYLGFSDPNGVYATQYYPEEILLQRSYPLRIQGGHLTELSAVLLRSGLNTTLVRAGGINGHIQAKDGTPAANVAVEAYIYADLYGWQLVAIADLTDVTGNYAIQGLPAGIYRLCYYDLTGHYPIECDGSVENGLVIDKHGLPVQAGVSTKADHVLGIKNQLFLPLVARQGTCTGITEISQTECVALAAIAKIGRDLAGAFLDWFKDEHPCHWSGITCSANHITRLKLAWAGLSALPPEFGNLTYLEWLDLTYNPLTSLPPEFGQLVNLQVFGMAASDVTTLPPEFGNLRNLQELYLYRNPIKQLPAEIGKLSNLRILNLSTTSLAALPSTIGNLTKLEILNVNGTGLTNVPPEIGNLTSLHELNLGATGIETLPDTLSKLPNLQYLDLAGLRLLAIPPVVFKLHSLQHLNFFANALTAIPAQLGSLQNLQLLDLSANHASSLAPEVGNLPKLTMLSVADNELSTVPATLGKLSNLRELYLSKNRLKSIPPELGRLQNLQKLTLSGNRLSVLPREIGQLAHLQSLDLSGNPMPNLPPEIGNLASLQELNLCCNALTALPATLGKLGNLRVLYLENNFQLSGPLPADLTNLALYTFRFEATNLCEPTSADFQAWLKRIPDLLGTGIRCSADR